MTDYSRKDFTGKTLIDKTDMDDLIITGSCFSQEKPDSHIFPENMTGTTLVACNLDNCFIPPGNTVEGGSRNRFLVQEDGYDWIIDENNVPIQRIG